MLDEWYKWISSKLIKYVPVRTKFRSTLSPWISSSTSHKIKQLNTAKKHHKNVFHLEGIVKDMISHDFSSYQEKVFSSRDTHLLFKHFKSLRNSNSLPEKMHFNDVELTSPAKKADCINSFFHSVYLPCDDKSWWFPPRSIDGSAFHYTGPLCSDHSITLNQIASYCSALDVLKTRGPDNLPPVLFKELPTDISKSICLLFSNFKRFSSFPQQWKVGCMSPLNKKGSPSSITNYRPVCLLNTASKLFERFIYQSLFNHFQSFLTRGQHGFVKRKTTATNLLEFLRQI